MTDWLHDRVKQLEDSHDDLYFPRYGTFNWMRSVAILCDRLDATAIRSFYHGNVNRRASRATDAERIDTETFCNLFLSAQYYSALLEFEQAGTGQSEVLARISIMDWYYGLYWSANAMLVAKTGTHPESHAPAARQWCTEFAMRNLIPEPFSLHVTTLVEADYTLEVSTMGDTANPALTHNVRDRRAAARNCLGALKGTAKWYHDRKMDEIRNSSNFKRLGVTNFRKKTARTMRDSELQKSNCGFLHQAFRARGKANYRDALYFGYGDPEPDKCALLIEDLTIILETFLLCAASYCRRRVQQTTWRDFIDDLKDRSWLDEEAISPLVDAQ